MRVPSGDQVTLRRRLLDARDLRHGAFGVHVADEDLRAARLALRGVGDAIAGRRPARAAAADEEAVLAAVGVHDPQRRLAAVGLLVDPAARVDDLRPVGRDLRIGDGLVFEIEIEGQAVGGRCLGRDQCRRGSQCERPRKSLHRPSLLRGAIVPRNGPALVG